MTFQDPNTGGIEPIFVWTMVSVQYTINKLKKWHNFKLLLFLHGCDDDDEGDNSDDDDDEETDNSNDERWQLW